MPKGYREHRETNKLVYVRLLGDGKWVGMSAEAGNGGDVSLGEAPAGFSV